MQGIRFYLEYGSLPDKRKNRHSGNVFAAFVPEGRCANGDIEGVGAVFSTPNSPVAFSIASIKYLRQCKRISEKAARGIHPELFKFLQ